MIFRNVDELNFLTWSSSDLSSISDQITVHETATTVASHRRVWRLNFNALISIDNNDVQNMSDIELECMRDVEDMDFDDEDIEFEKYDEKNEIWNDENIHDFYDIVNHVVSTLISNWSLWIQ